MPEPTDRPQFKPGEIVDITIKGVRIADESPVGLVWFGVRDRYGNVQLTNSKSVVMQVAESVNQDNGPMTLVHREDEQTGAGS